MTPEIAAAPADQTPAAARLLDGYQPGSFFLATARHTLLAAGARRVLGGPGGDRAELPAQVAAALAAADGQAGRRPPVAVGALPFGADEAPRMVIPGTVRRAGPLGAPPRAAVPPPAAAGEVEEIPARDGYAGGVRAALARIEAGELRKVVLARSLRIALPGPADVRAMLRALAGRDPYGYTYAADLPPSGRGARTLVGASPELLVAKSGSLVTSNPLAGSAARRPDPADDEDQAAALLASAKDRDEHAVVVTAVAEALRPYCRRLEVPAEPRLTRTASMWHLSTPVTGWLADPGVSALTLAQALHPTPAVCGVPLDAARRAIGEIEPFRRGYYAGAVGWCDANGDGEWTVAIRSAEAEGDTLRLFAGAGIVAGSDPGAELAETSAKFTTLLSALGMR